MEMVVIGPNQFHRYAVVIVARISHSNLLRTLEINILHGDIKFRAKALISSNTCIIYEVPKCSAHMVSVKLNSRKEYEDKSTQH